MARIMPPQPPTTPTPTPPSKSTANTGWIALRHKAQVVGSVVGLFVALVLLGAGGGYFYSRSQTQVPAVPKTTITNLSAEDLAKLGQIGNNLGSSGQTLNIGADSLFRGAVNVTGDATVGGRIDGKGTANLGGLNLTGPAAGTSLNLSSNLNVAGTTTIQQSLSVAGLATFTGGLNAGGNTSVNALNAASISVRNITITGPLTVAHVTTQGPTPTFVAGPVLGAGGTASLSGNDTAGTVNINTGSGPSAGVLGTITFRAAYTGTVHVLISATTAGAANTPVYVTRTSGGFQIHAAAAPPAGSVLSFDYLVSQ